MNKYYIYLHVKLTNGEPFYIGKGCGYRSNSKHGRSDWWNKTIDKYGFDVILLETNLNEEQAIQREGYWINRIGRRDLNNGPLINQTDGGDGVSGRVCLESTKEKLRLANLGKNYPYKCKRNGRLILNIETGIFYERVGDAAKTINIKNSTLYAQLDNQNKNKTNFIFV